jgi:CRP-like cAMP-binding protein
VNASPDHCDDGIVRPLLVLGVAQGSARAVVQGQGWALRLSAEVFAAQLVRHPSIKLVMERYVAVLMNQLITSTGCLHYHDIGSRVARWLLMSQDRARSDGFKITHEFMAYMLGVRRVSITGAASVLQQAGLIKYSRGNVTVLNRTGLEKAACSCYAIDRQHYVALLSDLA